MDSETGKRPASPPYRGFSLDDRVGHLLRRAYQRASAHLADRLRGHNLTPVQFAVLMRVWEKGALSQNQLGREVSMPSGNIHTIVTRLAKRGLLTTSRDPEDRRLLLVSLSAKGKKLAEKLIPIDLQASMAALAPLDPDEQEVFLRLLKRMA